MKGLSDKTFMIPLADADLQRPDMLMPLGVRINEVHPIGKLKRISFVGSANKLWVDDHNCVFSVWFDRKEKKAIFVYQFSTFVL